MCRCCRQWVWLDGGGAVVRPLVWVEGRLEEVEGGKGKREKKL